jgi:ferrochelatase
MIGNISSTASPTLQTEVCRDQLQSSGYIHALTSYAKNYLDDIDKLIFSYHSLSLTQVEAGWKKGKEYDYVYQLKETNSYFVKSWILIRMIHYFFYSSQRGKNWFESFSRHRYQ